MNIEQRSVADAPFVQLVDGVMTMHFGDACVMQSVMSIDRPHELEAAYTRAMMAFVLLMPSPKDILVVGVGGGSIPKYLHRRFQQARITAVELRAQVVEVARSHFGLPPDDERLTVIVQDGVEHLAECSSTYDLILLDIHCGDGYPSAMLSEAFYRTCRNALRPTGLLASNLWTMQWCADDRTKLEPSTEFEDSLRAMERAFGLPGAGHFVRDYVNFIAFISANESRLSAAGNKSVLRRRAGAAKRRYGVDCTCSAEEILRILSQLSMPSAA